MDANRTLPRIRRLAATGIVAGLLVAAGLPAAWSATRPDVEAGSLRPLGPEGTTPVKPPLGGDGWPRPITVPARLVTASRIGTSDASIEALPTERTLRPLLVRIPAIGVVEPVLPVGVDGEGAMALPPDPYDVGWYRFGSAPGEPGSTVLAAHVDWNGRPGPFFRLRELVPGQTVIVELRGGSVERYEVIARRRYEKDALPARAFIRHGPAFLTLITCGGTFDTASGRYLENVVVFAVPVVND